MSSCSDATDSASPPQTRRKRSAKTNAERGRAFRERRNRYTGELEVAIYKLRAEIAELESMRALWQSTQLHAARVSDTGALVRLIREYFSLFRFGFRFSTTATANDVKTLARRSLVSPEVVRAKINFQEQFLRRVMASDARVGDGVGPEASISNWNGYTLAHGNQRIDVHHVAAIGSGDHVVTEAHVTFNGKITETTFRVLYPRALHRHDLLAIFLHRPVQFHAIFRHEFTADGQIQFEGVEIGFVDGLLGTGASMGDVMELLRLSIVSPQHTIADRIELPEPEPPALASSASPFAETLDETSSSAASEDDGDGHKLRMEYILTA